MLPSDSPDEAAWDAAAALHDAALARLDAREIDEADRLARQAVDALDRAVGPDHPDAANARVTLARIAAARARYAESAALAREAVDALAPLAGEPVVDEIRLVGLEQLGEARTRLADYAGAEEALDAALALAVPRADLAAARVQNARGVAFKFAGRYDEAQAAYDDARARHERAGEALPATLLHNLAGLAWSRGDFAESERYAREAVARRSAEGDDDLALGQDLVGLADALAGLGRLDEAEATYRDALARYRVIDPEHPEVAYALHNLGDALADAGRAGEAERCYHDAIALKLRVLGPAHPEVAATRANLATLLGSVGREPEARALAEESAAIARALPAGHPIRVGCEAVAARWRR